MRNIVTWRCDEVDEEFSMQCHTTFLEGLVKSVVILLAIFCLISVMAFSFLAFNFGILF